MHLVKTEELYQRIGEIDWIYCIVAALGHDLAHPGKDNVYLQAVGDELCLKYNDHMVLENMHCAKIFQVIKMTDCNFYELMKKDDKKAFRQNLIYLVLGTDFSTYIETAGKLNCFIKEKTNKDYFKINTSEPFILSVALKCADIGHFAKEALLYEKWNALLLKEYLELPETKDHFIKGREVDFFINNQRFIKEVVFPLYNSWILFINQNGKEITSYLSYIRENLENKPNKGFIQSTAEINTFN